MPRRHFGERTITIFKKNASFPVDWYRYPSIRRRRRRVRTHFFSGSRRSQSLISLACW